MRRLTRDRFVSELSKGNPPAYSVEDGETILVETPDCHGGFVERDGTLRPGAPGPNPSTGPLEVRGSQPGEALGVAIHEVKPADWGFVGGGEGEAGFMIVRIEGGAAVYPWGLQLPVNPIIGAIGVAPPGDPVPMTTPSDWGGNLDTADVCAGATVYLPVAIPGGMLALGDVHALQGDSECCGTGIECAAEVTLTVKRVEDPLWPSVYLVRDEKLMIFAHGETVDEAAWGVVDQMAKLLAKLTGLSDLDSRRLLSTAGDVRISQMVNPRKTCRAIIPRQAIPDHWPF
jgi:amidase